MDLKDMRIEKMNALTHAVKLIEMSRAASGDMSKIELSKVVDIADRLTAWILSPESKYLQ